MINTILPLASKLNIPALFSIVITSLNILTVVEDVALVAKTLLKSIAIPQKANNNTP